MGKLRGVLALEEVSTDPFISSSSTTNVLWIIAITYRCWRISAGNIYNCDCYIFNPVLNSESTLWKPCRRMYDSISEEAAGVVYRDVTWFILFMNIGLLNEWLLLSLNVM